jgi:hypothetical protein
MTDEKSEPETPQPGLPVQTEVQAHWQELVRLNHEYIEGRLEKDPLDGENNAYWAEFARLRKEYTEGRLVGDEFKKENERMKSWRRSIDILIERRHEGLGNGV